MTTIETTESISQEKSLQIGDDPCIACGYSLLGIADDGKCPECGLAAIRSRQRRTIEDLPEKSLRRMATGAGMLVLAGILILTGILLLTGFDYFYFVPRFNGPIASCMYLLVPMVITGLLFRGAMLYAASGQPLWEVVRATKKRRGLWYCITTCAAIQLAIVWVLCIGGLVETVAPGSTIDAIPDRFFPIVWVLSLLFIPVEFALVALLAGRAKQMAKWTSSGKSLANAIRGSANGTFIAIAITLLVTITSVFGAGRHGEYWILSVLNFTLLLWTMMFLDARKLPARELRRRTLARRSVQAAAGSVISAPPIDLPQ